MSLNGKFITSYLHTLWLFLFTFKVNYTVKLIPFNIIFFTVNDLFFSI